MFRLIVASGAIVALAGCVAVPGGAGYYGGGYGAAAPYAGYGYSGYDAYDTGAYPYYYGDAPVVSGGISIWGGGGSDGYYRDRDHDRRPDRWHGGANAPGRGPGNATASGGGGRAMLSPDSPGLMRRQNTAPARSNNGSRGWGRERWSN